MESQIGQNTQEGYGSPSPARSILRNVAGINFNALRPVTRRSIINLRKRARAALKDPDADQMALLREWDDFEPLVKYKRRHSHPSASPVQTQSSLELVPTKSTKRRQRKHHQCMSTRREQRLRFERNHYKRLLMEKCFAFGSGDWQADICKAARSIELDGPCKDAKRRCREYHYNVQGMRGEPLQAIGNNSAEWTLFKSHTAGQSMYHIKGELDRIRQWHAQGGDEASAPASPYLDRMQEISSALDCSRVDLLWATQKYAERNEIAHEGGIDLEDHYNDDADEVDWRSVRKELQQRKERVEVMYQSGEITSDHRDGYIRLMDFWWRLHVKVCPEEPGLPVLLSPGGKDRVEKMTKIVKKEPTLNNPDLQYLFFYK